MIEDMTLRNLAASTQESYVHHVVDFSQHFGRSPDLLGPKEVREYQLHLLTQRKLSPSTLTVAVCALRFLYGTTLGRPWVMARILMPKRPIKEPVVLSP
jgi:hypothetical protein